MSRSNVEPLFTPNAPCAKNPKKWANLEVELEDVISWRASKSRKIAAAEPMVTQFCAHCPIRRECYDIANAAGSDYTGIAGGALFHEGKATMGYCDLNIATATSA